MVLDEVLQFLDLFSICLFQRAPILIVLITMCVACLKSPCRLWPHFRWQYFKLHFRECEYSWLGDLTSVVCNVEKQRYRWRIRLHCRNVRLVLKNTQTFPSSNNNGKDELSFVSLGLCSFACFVWNFQHSMSLYFCHEFAYQAIKDSLIEIYQCPVRGFWQPVIPCNLKT